MKDIHRPESPLCGVILAYKAGNIQEQREEISLKITEKKDKAVALQYQDTLDKYKFLFYFLN